MSDSTSTPSASPETPPFGGAPPPPETPSEAARRRPFRLGRGTALALLFGVALGIRLAVLLAAGPATSRELDCLEAAAPAADGTTTLLTILRRVAPGAQVGLPSIEGVPLRLDPTIAAARWVSALLGAVAAVLLALAAGSLGGRRSAICAGGLLALSPFAVARSTLAEPVGLLLFATSGALLGLVRWSARPSALGALGTGAAAGLAAATGGGGAALLLGAPWAARRADGVRLTSLVICALAAGIALAAAAPGSLATLPSLPRGVASAAATSPSPLLAGLRVLASSSGWIVAALALVGIARTLLQPNAAARAVLVATGGLFVLTLLRSGAEPTLLAGAIPGVILLASLALAEPRERTWTLPLPRLVLAATLVFAAAGAAALVASRWAPTPADAASDWIRRNLPDGAAFLLEEPAVQVATAKGLRALTELEEKGAVTRAQLDAYAAGSKTFGPALLPAPDTRGIEAALFYDPNLAQFFRWIILRDQLPRDDTAPELTATRRIFHDYFRDAWKEVAAFPPGLSRQPALVVLERPEKFVLDRARLAPLNPLLAAESVDEVRKSSGRFTTWLLEAGVALLASGEIVGSHGFLQLVTERDSTNAEAHYQLALVRLLRQRNDAAKASLLKALELEPFHGGAHYNLGIVLEAEGDVAGAETEYRAAQQYLDAPAIAHARLGGLLASRGDAAGARAELETVRRLDPGGEADRYLSHVLGAT